MSFTRPKFALFLIFLYQIILTPIPQKDYYAAFTEFCSLPVATFHSMIGSIHCLIKLGHHKSAEKRARNLLTQLILTEAAKEQIHLTQYLLNQALVFLDIGTV